MKASRGSDSPTNGAAIGTAAPVPSGTASIYNNRRLIVTVIADGKPPRFGIGQPDPEARHYCGIAKESAQQRLVVALVHRFQDVRRQPGSALEQV